ncbi:MAG: hypothetical protein A3H35_04520, partial [Betaproteobacteria bacterium RIFCSPLOWO2_02_FULL_62_17]
MLLLFLVVLGSGAVVAQTANYPSKPIKIIVPYPPGGGNDIPARIISVELGNMWGQPVVVENRSGAAGTVGSGVVARAAPDGYTILLTSASHTITPSVMTDMSYDVVKDFAGVNMILKNPAIILVPASSPLKTMQDLIAKAKSEPGKLSYSTVGPGTVGHLVALALEQAAGISLLHVPYRGGAPAFQALAAAEVDSGISILNGAMPLIRAGKIRALALDERSSFLPEVPSLADLGFKDISGKNWVGLFAPAATPRPVINKLNQAVSDIMRKPDIKEKFT